MFLSYPLLSQHRDEAGKRTIETGEIRVGKAMVRRSKAMKPLTINPETREGKVLRVLPSGR